MEGVISRSSDANIRDEDRRHEAVRRTDSVAPCTVCSLVRGTGHSLRHMCNNTKQCDRFVYTHRDIVIVRFNIVEGFMRLVERLKKKRKLLQHREEVLLGDLAWQQRNRSSKCAIASLQDYRGLYSETHPFAFALRIDDATPQATIYVVARVADSPWSISRDIYVRIRFSPSLMLKGTRKQRAVTTAETKMRLGETAYAAYLRLCQSLIAETN